MFDVFAGNWLTIVLRGVAAGLFGLLALMTPQLTLGWLESLFALYALLDGGLALLLTARARRRDPFAGRLWLTDGVAGAVTGLLVLGWPDLTLLALLLLVAVRVLAMGAVLAVAGFHLRRAAADGYILGAIGAAAVAFGLVLIVFPAVGVVGLVWAIALFAIMFGAALGTLGERLRRYGTVAGGLTAIPIT